MLRISALLHLSDGVAVAEVTTRVGVGESSAYAWLRAFLLDRLNRYFPEVDLVCAAVEEGLAYVQAHPADVKQLMGTYLDHMAGLDLAA